jgi:hypothetical protein
MRLTAEPLSTPTLFDWSLVPSGPISDKSVPEKDSAKAFEALRNRLRIGTPQVVDLRRLQGAGDSTKIDFKMFEGDFRLVRLACSFDPDRRSRYTWAKLLVELKAISESSNATAIAFDMYPTNVERQTAVKRNFELAPSIKFSFMETAVKGSTSREAVIYEPLITAGGLLTESPSWTFASSDRTGIIGSREMFLVLKLSKGARCGARFKVAAEVRGQFGPIPLRRPDEVAGSDELVMLDPE